MDSIKTVKYSNEPVFVHSDGTLEPYIPIKIHCLKITGDVLHIADCLVLPICMCFAGILAADKCVPKSFLRVRLHSYIPPSNTIALELRTFYLTDTDNSCFKYKRQQHQQSYLKPLAP